MSVRVALTVSPTWADISEAVVAMRDFLNYARGRGFGDRWLRISGVHIAYGGDAVTAALARAGFPNSGWSGFIEQANSKADFRDYCMLAAEHDLRVHTIVGDQLHDILPLIEQVAERYSLLDRRWVIEHVGRARMDDLRTLKRLGLCVTTIPVLPSMEGRRPISKRAGRRKSGRAAPAFARPGHPPGERNRQHSLSSAIRLMGDLRAS